MLKGVADHTKIEEIIEKLEKAGVNIKGNKIQKDYDIIDDVDINNTITSMYTDDIAIITKYTGNEEIVTIPAKLGGKRVYQIGEAAFYQNTSIKKLIIPDKSVGYIERGAFADCTNLSEVVL